jgi:hypothetical protein
MDEFAWLVTGSLIVGILILLAIGKWYPRSAADVVDWKPTRCSRPTTSGGALQAARS